MNNEHNNAPPVLQGGKLVPLEPTPEIIEAICHAKNLTRNGLRAVMSDTELASIYRAMLAATPDPAPAAGILDRARWGGQVVNLMRLAEAADKAVASMTVPAPEAGSESKIVIDVGPGGSGGGPAEAALIAGDAGWQPIETAPKDGSDCWLLVDGDVRRGFWVEIEFEERRDMDGRYIDQTDADAYWMDHDSGDSLEPTMFYPITKPLPPSLVDIDAAMRKDNT